MMQGKLKIRMIIDFSVSVLLLGTLCHVANCGPIQAKQQDKIVKYLIKYGYLAPLDPNLGGSKTEKQLKDAVKLFQRVAGIPQTGDLTDSRTLQMIHQPRCGMSDFKQSGVQARRHKRYVLQGSKWNKKDLTYKIVNYTPDLPKQETRDTIVAAFGVWSKVAPLTFTETDDDNADIKIKFVAGYHADGYPFDGKGGTLAHAFYPHDNEGISGDAHFDEDETFTLRTDSGVNLFWVAVHEFGHSLGLGHSFSDGALMYPFYRGYVPDLKLHSDDINGMQDLYGKSKATPTTIEPETTPKAISTTVQPETAPSPTTTPSVSKTTPPPTRAPSVPETCDTSVDVMVHAGDGYTYAFKGDYFWPISDRGQWTGALKISDFWSDLPGNLDAAFTRADKTTLFFKGSSYWVFEGRARIEGPLEITNKELNLPKELADMDASLAWGGNRQTYFLKGDKFWRYNNEMKRVDDSYPKLIQEAWRGLPNNLDAAVQWKNGKSYFFKDLNYYQLDDLFFDVSPNYPKRISKEWMGCSADGNINP